MDQYTLPRHLTKIRPVLINTCINSKSLHNAFFPYSFLHFFFDFQVIRFENLILKEWCFACDFQSFLAPKVEFWPFSPASMLLPSLHHFSIHSFIHYFANSFRLARTNALHPSTFRWCRPVLPWMDVEVKNRKLDRLQ